MTDPPLIGCFGWLIGCDRPNVASDPVLGGLACGVFPDMLFPPIGNVP